MVVKTGIFTKSICAGVRTDDEALGSLCAYMVSGPLRVVLCDEDRSTLPVDCCGSQCPLACRRLDR